MAKGSTVEFDRTPFIPHFAASEREAKKFFTSRSV
jgi:hypothetical protein